MLKGGFGVLSISEGALGGLANAENGLAMVRAFCGNNIVGQLEHLGLQPVAIQIALIAIAAAVMIVMLLLIFVAPSSHKICSKKQPGKYEGLVIACLAVLCVMTFSGVSEFIYFQF